MTGDPVLQLLGLAARAGAVVPGTGQVVDAVRGGRAAFALVADDLTETGRSKLVPLLEREGVPYRVRHSRAQLGQAVGRSPLAAVAVVDAGFGERLSTLLADGGQDRQHNSK